MGEEFEGDLALPVMAVGNGRVDGQTRAIVTRESKTLRAKILLKTLSEYPDQTARPVWAFPQFDEMSCIWLQATPSSDTYMSSPARTWQW